MTPDVLITSFEVHEEQVFWMVSYIDSMGRRWQGYSQYKKREEAMHWVHHNEPGIHGVYLIRVRPK